MIVAGIPAYNEEKTIARVILFAQKCVDVVVVCDDGSDDLTAEIAQRLGATVIRHTKNMGYGAAVQALFEKARALNAEILLTLDADGQHDPREMPRLIQPIVEGKADIVVGSRFLNKAHGMPLYRRIGVKVLTKMTNGSKGKGDLTDGQSGFRAYNRKAIDGLTFSENGMGASAEVLMKARPLGLVVAEVPVEVRYKGLETSTHNPLRHGWTVLATIIRLVVEERPLLYLGLPGGLLLMVGMGFGVWTLSIYASAHYIVTNLALVALAFGMAGIFCLFTSITIYAIFTAIKRNKEAARNDR